MPPSDLKTKPLLSSALSQQRKHALYVLNFLLGAHIALVTYFNASFLESRGISEEWLGSLFIVGSLLSICVYYALPVALARMGTYRLLSFVAIAEFFLFLGMGSCSYVPAVLLMFVLSLALAIPLFYGLDILLEATTQSESQTGTGRSSFLTMLNIAYVISPFIAGITVKLIGFGMLYTLAAFMLIPFLFLFRRNFKTFKDPVYAKLTLLPTLKELVKDSDLRNIFIVQFLLKFFFAWMVIYTPIYLHQHIGFSLSSIGIIFSVMLIPFAILEWPLGHYADKRYGEKEFLIAGFVILAGATYYLSFITTADFAIWMLLLFITRIGGAIIEVMNEIYFFKKVDGRDTDTISAFRMLSPIAYIIGPALGSILLLFFPMQYLFGILGIIMLIGIIASGFLHDTQ
jgi:predicted MFS family arabinose efflux permease